MSARRIITAREQYECRLHFADAASSAASGGTDGCDPNTEDCSAETSVGGGGGAPHSPLDGTGPNTSNPGTEPSAGSNSADFYQHRAVPSSGGGGGGSAGASGGAASAVPYTPGQGVSQWHDQVLQGLQRNGLPATLAPQVEKQIGSESGGDPKAINNSDSNAVAGHPSQGLLQTVPSTFNTYHLPGDSMSITDPQANIDSAIGYAKSTYGPTLMNPQGRGMGSGSGY